jgi:myo-inositol-1(or 4)-monophosphatase
MLNTAVKAARRAGNIILRASQNLDVIEVSSKGENDFVSEVDRAAEQAIMETLHRAYPGHAILAEESGDHGSSEYQWIVDPLDGTTNFLHGMPQYAVSIALAHKGSVTQAVVFDPVRNDLYTASKGAGAYLNDRRIRVSKRTRLEGALIGTGFPYSRMDHADAYLHMLRAVMQDTAGVRRPGAASLDLCYVAAGYYDAFWEIGLSPWDIAAGTLLITEAGGLVGDLRGESRYMKSGNIVAGNPRVFVQLLQLIEPHLTAKLREA